MAYFLTAYNKTAKFEGGYANDPDDRGGETWKGIARKMWPNWSGWKIIDSYKGQPGFIKELYHDTALQILVYDFYRTEFWDKIRGNEIHDQESANEIYDDAVNTGVTSAIKKVQLALQMPMRGVITDETIRLLNNR